MQENVFIVLLAAGNESKPKKEGKQYLADEALKLNFSSRMSQIYALASTTVHKNRRKKNKCDIFVFNNNNKKYTYMYV